MENKKIGMVIKIDPICGEVAGKLDGPLSEATLY
jgi:hypothetical protein